MFAPHYVGFSLTVHHCEINLDVSAQGITVPGYVFVMPQRIFVKCFLAKRFSTPSTNPSCPKCTEEEDPPSFPSEIRIQS